MLIGYATAPGAVASDGDWPAQPVHRRPAQVSRAARPRGRDLVPPGPGRGPAGDRRASRSPGCRARSRASSSSARPSSRRFSWRRSAIRRPTRSACCRLRRWSSWRTGSRSRTAASRPSSAPSWSAFRTATSRTSPGAGSPSCALRPPCPRTRAAGRRPATEPLPAGRLGRGRRATSGSGRCRSRSRCRASADPGRLRVRLDQLPSNGELTLGRERGPGQRRPADRGHARPAPLPAAPGQPERAGPAALHGARRQCRGRPRRSRDQRQPAPLRRPGRPSARSAPGLDRGPHRAGRRAGRDRRLPARGRAVSGRAALCRGARPLLPRRRRLSSGDELAPARC